MEIGSTTLRRSQTNRFAITNVNRQFAVAAMATALGSGAGVTCTNNGYR
jgi:hypothetical protein